MIHLHSYRPLPKNITPIRPVLGQDQGINTPNIIVPSSSFLSHREAGMFIPPSTSTHQMSEGVRWEGQRHLLQMGPGVFRRMDKHSDFQAQCQTENGLRLSQGSSNKLPCKELGIFKANYNSPLTQKHIVM